MRQFLIVLVVVSLVAGGGYAAKRYWGGNGQIQVKTVAVTHGPLRMTVETTGTVTPLVSVNVGCEVSGTVGEWLADFNSQVKKGEVLAKLRPELFEADLAQAEANVLQAQAQADGARWEVSKAKRQLEKVQRLEERKAATSEEVSVAKEFLGGSEAKLKAYEASILQAKALRDLAKTKLERSVIYAPMDGIVLSRLVDVGQTVAAALTSPVLFVMAPDLDKMQVDANVSESDIGRVRVGQTSTFTVDAYPDREFTGVVAQVRNNPTTIQGVVTYTVVIDVDNKARLLKPGMTANVTIEVARRDNVVKVANSALRFRPPVPPEQLAVLTANLTWPATKSGDPPAPSQSPASSDGADGALLPRMQQVLWTYATGKWKPVPVVLGITDNRETEVLSGLDSGGSVVISVQAPEQGFSFKEALKNAAPTNRSL